MLLLPEATKPSGYPGADMPALRRNLPFHLPRVLEDDRSRIRLGTTHAGRQGRFSRTKKRAALCGAALQFSGWTRMLSVRLELTVGLIADKAHLLDLGLLGDNQDLVDEFVTGVCLGLKMQLRNRVHLLRDVQILT